MYVYAPRVGREGWQRPPMAPLDMTDPSEVMRLVRETVEDKAIDPVGAIAITNAAVLLDQAQLMVSQALAFIPKDPSPQRSELEVIADRLGVLAETAVQVGIGSLRLYEERERGRSM
jgi:hypothetical protein